MTDKPIIQADFVKPMPVPSRKVLQLVFEVPEEQADHAMEVLGGYPQSGENRWCGIALLKPTATRTGEPDHGPAGPSLSEAVAALQPAEQTQERPKGDERATAMWSEAKRKMVQRAALVCKEEAFQNYIARGYSVMWNHERHGDASAEDKAAYHVRMCCGVKSRSDIDPAEESGARFRDLMRRYEASQRGETDAKRWGCRA